MKTPNYGFIFKLIRAFLYPWFSHVRALNADYASLKELQDQGQLVFVSHVGSLIDFFIINDQLERNGLKSMSFAQGINPFLIKPFGEAFNELRENFFKSTAERKQASLEKVMAQINLGRHGYVFLKKGRLFGANVEYLNGYFGRMATQRRDPTRNVHLVPTSIFLTRLRKHGAKRTYWEIFFGTYDYPGRLRKIYHLLTHNKKGGTILSKRIDLNGELAKKPDLAEEIVEKRLRWTLLFHLNNEDRAYRGPTKRPKARKVRKILKEKRLNEELRQVAERTGRSQESVKREAAKNLNAIASETSERVINGMCMLFDYVWYRTLEGIDVQKSDLDRLRELSKSGPVAYLPCHRSHVDYLSIAYLFEKEGLNYPRIAAGDNLAKWPLGPILRRCGAFFLRRSFKGESIFPLVFGAYLRHVLRERHVLLFFLEGGRSRTGKLMHPKLGMLSMLLDAWRDGVVEDLPLVPVTIDYGKVFEGDSYLREKSGLPKQKENLASVLRSRKVLQNKHGVMRIRFAEPIHLTKYVEDAGFSRETLGFKARLPLLHKLSYEIMTRINERVTLTAANIVAGLLMGTPKRGMTQSMLQALFILNDRHLRELKVELAYPEMKVELALENALVTFEANQALVRVAVGGEVVVKVPEPKRAEMEYYKNNGLHFILDVCLYSMAFQILDPQERNLEHIHGLACEIYRLLKHEFLIQEDYPSPAVMSTAHAVLERMDAVSTTEDGLVETSDQLVGSNLLSINALMLQNFLESYFVVAEVACELELEGSVDKKNMLKQCMSKGQLLYAVGTLRCEESINHITFTNALACFSKAGYLKIRTVKGQKYALISWNRDKHELFIELKDRIYQWMQRLEWGTFERRKQAH